MFKFLKKKEIDNNIYAPINGTCIPIEEVKDKVFASKMMGDGVGFIVDDDTVYAPCDGTIVMIAATKHAFGIQADNGLEILVHIGLDTVNLNGEGLTALKSQGEHVNKGEVMIRIDRSLMAEKEIDLTTPMIVTNGNDYTLTIKGIGDKVSVGENVIIIKES